ncbi:MAG: ATP-binding protein [Desulfobulbaceae bacterium]|nr:ATP-binding protein [Desulfobulbaceae bacterium]
MKNRRLLWHLFPANLLITLGAVLVLSWFGATSVRDFYYDEMRRGLESRGRIIEQHIADLLLASPVALQNYCKQAGRKAATRITVVSAAGDVLADSNEDPAKMENHAGRSEIRSAMDGRIGSSTRFSPTLGENMLYVAIPLYREDRLIGALRVSVSTVSLDNVLQSIRLRVLAVCFLVLLAAAILTLFVSRRISRPLEQMKHEAEQMAREEKMKIMSVDYGSVSTEVASLAVALNRMAKIINERMRIITLQRRELETVFAGMTEMIMAVDNEKRILRINRSAAALFYLSPDDVQGKLLHGVIRNKDLHEIVDRVIAAGSQAKNDIVLHVGPDKVHLHTNAVPLQDENRNPIGVLIVMNDTTQLHKLSNLRRDFVANVSHELKTPVTSIQGYVETLLDGALEHREDARRFLEIIAKQSSRLDAIINDLLMLSRIERKDGHDYFQLALEPLKPVLESAVMTCQPQAEEKGIAIDVDCPEELKARINHNLLEQAVMNLLKNAVMYSPAKSRIKVSSRLSTSAGTKRVTISVEDQGTGIAAEHLDRLFERFYRCDKGRSKELGGTGLGLSIVKHIAMAHGGSVSVKSSPGQGSVFTISLPGNVDSR